MIPEYYRFVKKKLKTPYVTPRAMTVTQLTKLTIVLLFTANYSLLHHIIFIDTS